MTTAREMIIKAFSGKKNFVTPHVIRYGKINRNVSYELSSGRGLYNADLYGVTVVSERNNVIKKEYDISKSFYSLSEAEDYIKKLKQLMI